MWHHFGHAILECLSRLWFVAEGGAVERIAFLPVEDADIPSLKMFYGDFLELLDIDQKRVIYIEEPTQFDRVIVPDETVHSQGKSACYKEKYTVVCKKMTSRVEAKNAKKIYLTRTQLANSGGCLNEEYFEEFYKRRGFKVIAPEQLKLKDQIAYMKGAEEVACTMGTLSHLPLFARPGTRLTCLLRTSRSLLTAQMIINQAKELDFYVVDVSLNFLPVTHVLSSFLLGPSRHWREYLVAAKVEYAAAELEWDKGKWTYEYLQKWCEAASTCGGWNNLAAFDNFDFLNSLSTVLLDAPLKREDYPGGFKEKEAALAAEVERLKAAIADPDAARFEAQIAQLQAENNLLKDEVRRHKNSLKTIKETSSWKITAPLRRIMLSLDRRTQKRIRDMLKKKG